MYIWIICCKKVGNNEDNLNYWIVSGPIYEGGEWTVKPIIPLSSGGRLARYWYQDRRKWKLWYLSVPEPETEDEPSPSRPPPPPPAETTTGSRFSVLHCLVCLIPAIFRLPLSFLAPSQTTFVVAMLFTFDVFLSLSNFFFHTSTFYFFSLALIKK